MRTPVLRLDQSFEPRHGEAVEAAPGILRLTAPNPSPFTFHGTNSYLLGQDRLVLVDPGPNDLRHLNTIARAAAGRPVDAILLTHTHRDHTGLVGAAKAAFDAPVLAEGRHRPSRPLRDGETARLDASGDTALVPDRLVADGEVVPFDGGALRVVATPGHAANHVCFAVEAGPAAGTLLSGDHVMAWSTSIVAPPDGSMRDYMASLDKLLERDDRLYLPGHGGPVTGPRRFVRAMKAHRLIREAAIVAALKAGDRRIPEIVARIYRNTDPALHGAAALSVLAHLEDLAERGTVRCEGPPALGAAFEAV
ncbi:MBL fold metallo-hydrolase [Aureimonas leprariae]|uniref:MBL fold metallo-hydrolase n=1 Tax=Plantimonas leprariae TaxID=2615207 RepID=A0A7V7TWF7_9HYPH|nr:MBL fold metallo-hydrolase [Aureimonas leprariae]KAB0679555.1 MBL fold metallo-hydrolase [Aureimonas leprariae]